MNISYLIFGAVRVRAEGEHIASLLNLCMYFSIPYTGFRPVSNGVEMTFKATAMSLLLRESRNRGIEFEIVERSGIPAFFARYKKRFGIFLGIILAALLIGFSESFIWDINVIGNENITATEIKALLKEEGLFEGSMIRSVNTDQIENTVLMKTDNISWMSINIIGTVAEVQIREYQAGEDIEDTERPANLIAKKSGPY